MRTSAVAVLLCGTFLLGCGTETAQPGDPGDGTGGDTGSGGSGGKSPTATGGTTAPTGSGGSVGSGGSGSGGSSSGSSGSGGSATGGSGPSGSGGSTPTPDAGAASDSAPAPSGDASTPTPPSSGAAPYGCANCKPIFDGKSLDGWVTNPGSWEAKDGVLASTGKNGDIWTKDDYGDYRIFFQVRQIKGDHKPCTVLFGKRPAGTSGRGLGGAQFQPPNGASWDYGVGGTFTRLVNPNFNVNNWHQCEVLVKEAGSFRAACCPVGPTPCKGIEVLRWKGTGRKHPFDIMMHNPGLFDEYKEIWLEQNPTVDDLLSMK
jgi:hypothetical protein